MYIEYVTYDDYKVLHQLRDVEDGSDVKETMENAVKRLLATGFKRDDKELCGDLVWTDGKTEAYIHFGSLAGARKAIIRDIHEYSFLD